MAGGCVWQGGMHGRGHTWQGACVAGGTCMTGGHTWQGKLGMHGRGGHAWQGGKGACMAGEMAIAAGNTHPTVLHSCYAAAFVRNI